MGGLFPSSLTHTFCLDVNFFSRHGFDSIFGIPLIDSVSLVAIDGGLKFGTEITIFDSRFCVHFIARQFDHEGSTEAMGDASSTNFLNFNLIDLTHIL